MTAPAPRSIEQLRAEIILTIDQGLARYRAIMKPLQRRCT
jgi:hypothetical protein